MDNLYPWFHQSFSQLSQMYRSKSLSHALLINADGGLGSTNLVQHLARHILCLNSSFSHPSQGGCGKCKSCVLFNAESHPDIRKIQLEDDKKQIRVDQIRSLTQFIQTTGQQGGNKVVLIHPADQMNIQAANALLKNLEEPPAGTFIILLTERPAALLPTIRSRCFKLTPAIPSIQDQREWLEARINNSDAIDLLLASTSGKPCFALELFNGKGLEVREKLIVDLESFLANRLSTVEIAVKWSKLPMDLVLYWLVIWLTDACKYLGSKGAAPLRDERLTKVTKYTIKNADADSIFALTDYILETKGKFDRQANLNQQLVIEDFLIRWFNIVN